MKKISGIILDIIFFLMLLTGILLIIMRICGFTILSVETGSMGDACPVGSVIISESCSPYDIKTGDIISFFVNDELLTVTHRVVEIDTENRYFYTKGDENNIIDSSPVLFENLIGRMRINIPKIGYVFIWASTKSGKIIITFNLLLITVFAFLNSGLKGFERKGRRDDKSD